MQIDLEAALRLADRSEVQSGGNVAVYQLGAAVRGLVERVRELEGYEKMAVALTHPEMIEKLYGGETNA